MSQGSTTPWRLRASCCGVCHWHDKAWVCDAYRSEWYPERDPERYGRPGPRG
jgi:hypothetical protein